MPYPRYFRSNPADPITEITVYNDAQAAAVQESGYRHEAFHVTDSPLPIEEVHHEEHEEKDDPAPEEVLIRRGPGRPRRVQQ